jgi:hypothetical protein
MAKVATPSALVGEAYAIIKERDAKIAELLVISEKLIALGAGRYCDEADPKLLCTVVAAIADSTGAVSYSLTDPLAAREIAGIAYGKLFDRVVAYFPAKGFADLVPKFLTPAKAAKLLSLCLVPGKAISGKRAHILWK